MITDSQAEGVGGPINPAEQAIYPGTVVEAGDQTPPGVIGKGEVKFKHQVTPMPGSGTTKDENGVVAIKGESR